MYYTKEEYDFITSHGREMPKDIAGVRELIEELKGIPRHAPALISDKNEFGKDIIIIGSGAAVRYAYARLIAEGHNVTIEQQSMSGKWLITAPNPDMQLIKTASLYYHEWRPSMPKPKHRNGQYNQVNRKKNKASRKARKQNRK